MHYTALEQDKELVAVDKTIEAGVRELQRHQVLFAREQWLKEAERCENEGAIRTCEAIIKATIAMDVEEEDRFDTWTGDAEAAEAKGNIGAARAILAYALRVFPDKKSLWRKAADLEKAHGTKSASLCTIIVINNIDDLSTGNHSMPSSNGRCITVLRPKFSGSCGRRRSGWQATCLRLARSWSARSWPTQKASRFGLRLSSWRQRMAREFLVRARTDADTERVAQRIQVERCTADDELFPSPALAATQ